MTQPEPPREHPGDLLAGIGCVACAGVLGAQAYMWVRRGIWVPLPAAKLWAWAGAPVPHMDRLVVQAMVNSVLALPLSLWALLLIPLGAILSNVAQSLRQAWACTPFAKR